MGLLGAGEGLESKRLRRRTFSLGSCGRLEVDSVGECTAVQMCSLPWTAHSKVATCVYFVLCTFFFKAKAPLPSLHTLRQVFLKSEPSPAPRLFARVFGHSLGSMCALLATLPPPFLCLFTAGSGGPGCPSPLFANSYSVHSSVHSWDWTSA